MTHIHQVANTQNCDKKPCMSLYWDLQNVILSVDEAKLLLNFINDKGCFISKNVYYNSLCKDQASIKDALETLGFKPVDVPCTLKNSADNQLISDCLKDINSNVLPDVVVIVSGDGDFVPLVSNCKKLGIKVIIFARTGNVKQQLKQIADEFYFVEKLPDLVVKKHQQQKSLPEQEVEKLPDLVEVKPQPHTSSGKHKISYQDAIKWLIEAIQTALKEGKKTTLSHVEKLMRSMPGFPSCQKFPVVCKPDGKTFYGLGKFVDALVAEGKIKRQNQELFLIEEYRLTV